jgi:hypothetical protein
MREKIIEMIRLEALLYCLEKLFGNSDEDLDLSEHFKSDF